MELMINQSKKAVISLKVVVVVGDSVVRCREAGIEISTYTGILLDSCVGLLQRVACGHRVGCVRATQNNTPSLSTQYSQHQLRLAAQALIFSLLSSLLSPTSLLHPPVTHITGQPIVLPISLLRPLHHPNYCIKLSPTLFLRALLSPILFPRALLTPKLFLRALLSPTLFPRFFVITHIIF